MSKVWDHFDRVTIRGGAGEGRGRGRGGAGGAPPREEEARCKHCPSTYQVKKGGTSSLRYHLKNSHGRIYAELVQGETSAKRQREAEVEEVEEAEREYVSLVHETPRKRTRRGDADAHHDEESNRVGTLDKYRKFASGDRRQLKFDMAVTNYLVSSGLPFHHVESDSFKEFVRELQPRVTVKSANCFSQSKLPRLHSHMVRTLTKVLDSDLATCPGGALTTDIWTSRAGDPFLSLTIHYLSDWVLKRWTLGCIPFDGRHTAHRVAEALDGKLSEFPILTSRQDLPLTLVHDAASNMKAACIKSTNSLASLVCVDHRLQTVLRTTFSQIVQLDALMSKCTAIASRMHRSPLSCQLVKNECDNVGCAYIKVVTPVDTRWNSKYGMVQSLNTIRAGLESLRDRSVSIGGCEHLSDDEWELLREIEKILYRFDAASRELSGDKTITICQVMPHLFDLSGYCQRDAARVDCPAPVKELVQTLATQLELQFPDCGAREQQIAIGNLLHPYFKGTFLKKYGAFDSTLLDLETFFGPPESPGSAGSGSQSQVQGASIDFFGDDLDPTDALMRELTQGETLAPEKTLFQQEVEAYMAMPRPVTRRECDVLLWWKEHETMLPLLSKAAKALLSIPASSASSERLWSVAGNIVTAKRYSLDTATTERLTFCQSNWQNLKAHGWNIDKEMEETADATGGAGAGLPVDPLPGTSGVSTPATPGAGAARSLFATSTPAAPGRTLLSVLNDIDSDDE